MMTTMTNGNDKIKVLVVGGGAAGMMAAYAAASGGAGVTVFERNEKLGKKIYITGKGRCNVTNASEMDVVFKNVNRNPKFLYSAFNAFDNTALMDLIEKNGCPLKTERGNRVFPVSDHASDIIKAMSTALKNAGASVRLNSRVQKLLFRDGACVGLRLENGEEVKADRVIVSTGGLSYPTTGSDGDGYSFAREAGHEIVDTSPSLVPLLSDDPFIKELQGLSLKNVELRLESKGKTVFKELGEMLFTHNGISGPLVLSASSYYDTEMRRGREVKAFIDLKPALDPETLDKRILRDFDSAKNKLFRNSLDELLPGKLTGVFVSLSGIDPGKQVNSVTKEEREHLGKLLKNFEIHISSAAPINEAVITRGGVNVKEINPGTMESKLVKNLFFAGEVLDLDAMTGGYNLQIAWSTGYLAGRESCHIR
ncbi:MAG: NAD(P)/FAD-dependent oxidoreductase [Lachnospiraceae bacterium]|nr:NAD(P)/FAD-dependent oxidoreductase [Lachnospiraceae bacterium]